MKSPGKQTKKTDAERAVQVASGREYARLGLLAVFVAVCVARPLVPSEAVSWLGDGHPFTMALLVITACYLLLAVERGGFTRPFQLVDAAVAALVLLCVASATLGILATLFEAGNNQEFNDRVSSPRLAINMLWEWVALGLVYFLARQLIASSLESRALVAAMIGLAVVLSAFGVFQVFVSLPAERAAYVENPDAVLRELGQWYPPESPERARFEDRLNSTEPLATFALANSLAGYLAPWLVVALGVTWNIVESRAGGHSTRPNPRRGATWTARVAGLAVCLAAILICLVLTKSRSAYMALAVGLVLLPLSSRAWAINGRLIAAAGVVLALAFGVAVAAGGLDAEVLTEASKSLEFRWQYWQATLDMIAQFPVFGVGPGEFQDYYTQFKLPEASEEVRDPHNFLLEVWATAGTPAFLALVVVLASFAWQSWESSVRGALAPDGAAGKSRSSRETIGWVAAGAAIGIVFAFGIGPAFGFSLSIGQLAGGLAIGAAVLAILWPWVSAGNLPPGLPALGVLVLAINLLAAGGFTFPGVAGTFWMLLALGLNARPLAARAEPAAGETRRLAPAAALGITIAAAVACYSTAFQPVLASRVALARAADEQQTDEGRFAALLEAADADPFSAEPWMAVGRLCLVHLKQDPHGDLWGKRFLRATSAIVSLRGHSSAAWREIGHWHREIYEADPNPEMADHILQLARGAAFLYPNSAPIQAEYALALDEVGKTSAARRSAAKALELDGKTPHADKKLSPQLKRRLKELLAETKQP
ncbi:MAG: O-antigen ligase family protein [Pirellulales bacterium]